MSGTDPWAPSFDSAFGPTPAPTSSPVFVAPVAPTAYSTDFVSDFNYAATIYSQFGTAASLLTIVAAMNQWINPAADFDAFFNYVWNIDTAQGIGLDIWGRILGVGRVLQVAPTATGKYLGFSEAGTTTSDPWGHSPFYTGEQTTNNFVLSDSAFRVLLYAKALANICDGSIPGINQVLLYLFPSRGNCYVAETGPMEIAWTFDFALSAVEVAIVELSGVLPKPTGVSATLVQNAT
jgi:hypothetical protein